MRRYHVTVGGSEHVVDVQEVSAHEFRVSVGGQDLDVTLSGAEDVTETVISPEIAPRAATASAPSAAAFKPARPETLPPLVAASLPPLPQASDGLASGAVKAPMPGTITAVAVSAGEAVTAGQVLVKLEAMKMVNAIKSPRAARVRTVHVAPGESVGYGHVLVSFDEA
jgi:glutaconyl-CoA/methylmalonyl-CoA decarboxylase subunit gamma